jgi:hypothetical protein
VTEAEAEVEVEAHPKETERSHAEKKCIGARFNDVCFDALKCVQAVAEKKRWAKPLWAFCVNQCRA